VTTLFGLMPIPTEGPTFFATRLEDIVAASRNETDWRLDAEPLCSRPPWAPCYECVTTTATAVRTTDRWPVLHHVVAGFEKTRSQCGPKPFRRWILQPDHSLHALRIAAGMLGARPQVTTQYPLRLIAQVCS
jgi:hypothetical protein